MFKNVIYKMCLEILHLIYTNKKDLALNDLQWLIFHKTKSNQTISDKSQALLKLVSTCNPLQYFGYLFICDVSNVFCKYLEVSLLTI